jgi:hypothetical protein
MLGLNKPEPEKKEYFFALEIDIGRVKSAIWTIDGDQSQLLSLGEIVAWEKEEEILAAVDTSLSSAVEKLTPSQEGKEPEKIIFGLSSEWIEENKITPQKAEILKKISQKMELSPLGFVVIPEAIAHWLKKLEGVPLNGVLIGLGKKKITVSLVEAGRVVETNLVVRSENLGADLTEGLSRSTKEGPFPARILLYDHEEKLEEARQELINWPWQDEKINFLHLPKVEILSADFDIKSIVLASASQIAEVKGIKEAGAPIATQAKGVEEITEAKKEVQEEEKEEKKEEKEETKGEKELEEEVSETKERDTEEPKAEEPAATEPENLFGFVKNQDISQISPQEEPELVVPPKKEFMAEEPSEPEEKPKLDLKPKLDYFQNKLGFFKSLNLGGLFASFRQTLSQRSLAVFLLTGIILLVLLAGLWSLYWFLPKANIVLTVKPKVLEKDFVIELDPSLTTADKENLILPAEEIQTTVEGEKEANTTGTKLVGDKAKGKVMIYNRTSQEKTLSAGTIITGPEDLEFTLNEGVTVASESAGSDYVKIPGKAEVEVTAVAIGSEGNLASGSEFSVGNLAKSDFVAKNEGSFSEGSSREVQVVAEDDEDKLLAELQSELEEEALADLKTKLTSGQKLVEESLTTQVAEKSFDKKVNDEADKVKLTLQLKTTALSFQEDEFKQLAEVEIRSLVPSDFDYDPEKTEIDFEPETSTKKDVFAFQARFKADLVPKLNLEEIKSNLLGKKPVIGKTYLSNLPNVVSFEAQISPKLPESIATFPRLLKRIKIEVETE